MWNIREIRYKFKIFSSVGKLMVGREKMVMRRKCETWKIHVQARFYHEFLSMERAWFITICHTLVHVICGGEKEIISKIVFDP
jgi:hypothetical protein